MFHSYAQYGMPTDSWARDYIHHNAVEIVIEHISLTV